MTYPTQNAESQAGMTPERALALLAEGNRRFVSNAPADRDLLDQVAATRKGQWPYAIVLSCIDSRASAELILDAGIGDLFSVRIAGNVIDENALGCLEFGCAVAGARLLVVMGHTHCGAVKGACDGVELGNLTHLLGGIRPVLTRVPEPADPAQRTSSNSSFVTAVARENVTYTLENIRHRSEVLRELEADGKIAMVGAMYDIETGSVSFDAIGD